MAAKKTTPSAYILAPGQSLTDYKQLEKLWYDKLAEGTTPSTGCKSHASPSPAPTTPGTDLAQPNSDEAACKKRASTDLATANKGPKRSKSTASKQPFHDIEHLDDRGFSSRYMRDYPLHQISASYSPEEEEYWRRCRAFLHHWTWYARHMKGMHPPMAKFIWFHYSEGFTMRQIVGALEGGDRLQNSIPRKRYLSRPEQEPPTLFWVFDKLTNVLLPAFNEWCKSEAGQQALAVDWDLES